MPGWIIQGVRGEGKGIAAMYLMKRYLDQGRPVATNMDLFLENFLSPDNSALVYRLPDHPRACDLEALPPAFDRDYKGEDKNGILVLDELGTWMNTRSWNDKDRKELLNWLFLSRKDHWDLALLAQNVDMIDKQASDNLCDYLVQASRTDRKRIPYIGGLLRFLGFSGNMSKVHVYHVFYGLSLQGSVHEVWTVTGKQFYDGYDTNQRFRDGKEAVQFKHYDIDGNIYKTDTQLIDFRALYTYLPANYLTKHYYIQKHQTVIDAENQQIDKLLNIGTEMARSKLPGQKQDDVKAKLYLMSTILVAVVGYGIYNYSNHYGGNKTPAIPVSPPVATQQKAPASPVVPVPAYNTEKSLFSELFLKYRSKLVGYASTPDGQAGYIEFYENSTVVERFHLNELHSLGAAFIKTPYGGNVVASGQTFKVINSKLLNTGSISPTNNQESALSKLGL